MTRIVSKKLGLGAAMMAGLVLAAGCTLIGVNSHRQGMSSASGKSGNQLWQENCQRCHNFRSPDTLTDAQWGVVVQHMRIRANLTAEEHDKIVKFLKASN